MRKLRVLPVPDWAVARMSRPSRAGGIAATCTGVGVTNFALANCCLSEAERLKLENWFTLSFGISKKCAKRARVIPSMCLTDTPRLPVWLVPCERTLNEAAREIELFT